MLTIPSYIQAAKIIDRPIDFKWTIGGGSTIYDKENSALAKRMSKLAPRALLALSIGMAEWVVWRLSKVAESPRAQDFVKGAWAGEVDFRYFTRVWTVSELDLTSPAVEPVSNAMSLLSDVFFSTEKRSPASVKSCYLHALTHHILKKHNEYAAWLEQSLLRLEALFPKSDSTKAYHAESIHTPEERAAYDWGSPVPREALDPANEFGMDSRAHLLDQFLRQLSTEKNPYVRSAKEMKDLGFEGVPYTYSVDR